MCQGVVDAKSILSHPFKSSNLFYLPQVEAIEGCCVLAAVGQGMVNTKGVSATMMGALAKANVNIKAIAQVRGLEHCC